MQTDETRPAESGTSLQTSVATIVAAYVGNHRVEESRLPELIDTVAATMQRVGNMQQTGGSATSPEPAVNVKKSVTADFIICLEDGKKFKSLKRHLRTRYGLSPDEYRNKWGLPSDYPMVAPNYAKERSNLAKRMGLGTARQREA